MRNTTIERFEGMLCPFVFEARMDNRRAARTRSHRLLDLASVLVGAALLIVIACAIVWGV